MNAEELKQQIEGLAEARRADFAKKFLDVFLSNGFGAMTKRDIESLVFLLLRKAIPGADTADSYTWAKVLKITPSRINSLQLESHLRFAHLFPMQKPEELLQPFISGLVDIQIGIDSDQRQLTSGLVRIQVDDSVARMELEQAVKESGGIVDYERNRKILKLGFLDFLRLINKVTGAQENEVIEKIAEGKAKEGSRLAAMMDEVKAASYAQLSEGGKLKKFLELLGDTFAEKPKKLIDHLGLIFSSQKHHK
jgi:hypothetical protein